MVHINIIYINIYGLLTKYFKVKYLARYPRVPGFGPTRRHRCLKVPGKDTDTVVLYSAYLLVPRYRSLTKTHFYRIEGPFEGAF